MAVVVLLVACGGPTIAVEPLDRTTTPPAATQAAPTPTPQPTVPVPDATASSPSAREPYDPNRNMYQIWSGLGHPPDETMVALAAAQRNRDLSQVPVILEALRFMRLDPSLVALDTVAYLSNGEFDFDLRQWREMGEWLGRNLNTYAPPSEYAQWKIHVLSVIDPAMAELLEPAIDGAPVNLTEIMWGGVRLDGIPPLEQPPHVSPEEATWLLPDDRVFGVSINGNHRAYPLRVMNAHELANDELGGEPISLVY